MPSKETTEGWPGLRTRLAPRVSLEGLAFLFLGVGTGRSRGPHKIHAASHAAAGLQSRALRPARRSRWLQVSTETRSSVESQLCG
eukprot:9160890-Alexandrium_andersonii.AAC.1